MSCIHAAVLGICRSAASLQTFSCETAQLSFDSSFERMNGITACTTLNCSLTLGHSYTLRGETLQTCPFHTTAGVLLPTP